MIREQQDTRLLQEVGYLNVLLMDEYQTLKREYQALSREYQTLKHEEQTLTHEYQTLQHEEQTLTHEEQTLTHEEQTLTHEEQTLTHEEQTLTHEYQTLIHEFFSASSFSIASLITCSRQSVASLVRFVNYRVDIIPTLLISTPSGMSPEIATYTLNKVTIPLNTVAPKNALTANLARRIRCWR
ncbi:MAG: hypothetical protein KME30_10650 [Iphinoe sp. HA4291-MV1]|jgi:predicted nuclease with TOPRIM domain|nr:hypothetical protein [Iphinoe sp. HA4291-MV1]